MGGFEELLGMLGGAERTAAAAAAAQWRTPARVLVFGAEGVGKTTLIEVLRPECAPPGPGGGGVGAVEFAESAAYRPPDTPAGPRDIAAAVAAEVAGADVALWVLGEVATAQDRAVAERLRAAGPACPPVLGVLARGDLARADGHTTVQEAARHRAKTLGADLTIGVLPACVMLGRNGDAPLRLTGPEVEELRRMAKGDDVVQWLAPDLLVARGGGDGAHLRRQLLARFGLFGVAVLAGAHGARLDGAEGAGGADGAGQPTAEELGELMRKASGVRAAAAWLRAALWHAASVRAADVAVALEGALSGDRARDGLEQALRLPGLLASPWAPAVGTIGRALELAGGERLNVARAVTLREKHAALARYRHFLAVAQSLAPGPVAA